MRTEWSHAERILATAAFCFFFVSPAHGGEPPSTPDSMSRVAAPAGVTASATPAWKRVALGTYKNVNLLLEDLDSSHCGNGARQVASVGGVGSAIKTPRAPTCNLGETAAEIIGRPAFALSKARTDLDLVVVTPRDLGLADERVPVATVYARAELLGFALCPAEAGPQLRLQYLDQPIGETLHIAMRPIVRYTGEPAAFALVNGGAGLLLIGSDGNPDLAVPPTRRFVFVRPR